MKRHLFVVSFLSVGLVTGHAARAQMAVIDNANLAQNIQTAAQALAAVGQLKAQLNQLQETYAMFTTPNNILNMATGMENQAIENPMPDATALSGLIDGQNVESGAATAYFNQNHVYTATDGSSASAQLNSAANTIANIEGVASTNLSAIQQRLQQLPDLEADLNAATSITQVNAINGRIAAESQFVQAQQAQATNLQILATEQAQSQQQQQQEQFDQDMNGAAADMKNAAAANGGQ